MSIILAIESGGARVSVALSINGEIKTSIAPELPHSQYALPMVRQLLDEAGITLSQCDGYAFGAGPGRFSGLRLACQMAQSFAYNFSRPGIAVDSLAALAHANYGNYSAALKTPSKCRAALPAHRGHIYTANCQRTDRWRSPRPMLLAVEDWAAAKSTKHFCGEGFFCYPHLLPNSGQFSDKAQQADAAAVCEVAIQMLEDGETVAAADCLPRYIRRQVAQTIAARAKQ